MPALRQDAVQASAGLGQANVNVPVGVDCLPLLERGRGHMTGFGEEGYDCLYRSAFQCL